MVCWWWICSVFLCLKSLYFTFILKGNLARYVVLVWRFCLSALKMALYCLVTALFDEKSDILNFDSLDVTCHTPLILSPLRDFLFIADFDQLIIDLQFLVLVFFSRLLCLGINFLELCIYGFYYVWNVFIHYFFKYVLCLNIHHLLLGLGVLLY